MAFHDDDADQHGDGERREQAPPHLVPARRLHRYQGLIQRRYRVARLRLRRGVDPLGHGIRSAGTGLGTDGLVGIMGQNTLAMLQNLWSGA